MSEQANQEVKNMMQRRKKYSRKELKKSLLYKENYKWARKLIHERYTIVDLGNRGKTDYSIFYTIEKLIGFEYKFEIYKVYR